MRNSTTPAKIVLPCSITNVTEFSELKEALNAWVSDAIDRLSHDASARDYTTDLGHWRRDADGVFRDTERPIEVWDRHAVQSLFELPTWAPVLVALQQDHRLSSQVDTLIGTAQGAHRFEAVNFGRFVLPRPNELAQAEGTFEARYEELESFLAAHEIEYAAIWPLPGLTSDVLPVRLDTEVELSVVTDGCRAALERVMSGKAWPPDWDAMALGDCS